VALDEVTRDELQSILAQLKEALYSHQQWYDSLIRSIVCKLPADQHDTNPEGHKECRFGQWYYSPAPEKLRMHPGFVALGEEHERMHLAARMMLLSAENGTGVTSLDYDNFANTLERLRLEVYSLERELEDSLFNRDALTGAITRFGILPTLREQQELVKRRAQLCYIVMMDLDNFKAINDLHGHPAGDKVLSASIRYLIRHLRPYDKVFRYGGEEFLICMPYTDFTPGFERVNELKDELLALDIDIGESQPVHISASFGLALLDPDVPVETSIDRADKAMYAAKADGRNCVKVWESALET
jgi:diguanylate cyclase